MSYHVLLPSDMNGKSNFVFEFSRDTKDSGIFTQFSTDIVERLIGTLIEELNSKYITELGMPIAHHGR
jgi:hypothetical protein